MNLEQLHCINAKVHGSEMCEENEKCMFSSSKVRQLHALLCGSSTRDDVVQPAIAIN